MSVARASEYRGHMRSATWARIRSQADSRSLGLCELCGSAARETHHIKYPKSFANDSPDNVLRVCSPCHRRLHGMNRLISDRSLEVVSVDTFKGRPVKVWVDERRWVWAPWTDGWLKALVIPRSLEQRITHLTAEYARKMEREWGEPYCLPDKDGMPWYRWHPVEEALTVWRVKSTEGGNAYREQALSDDERFLMQNISAIRKWGKDLQERALSGAIDSRALSKTEESSRLAQAMALIAGVTQEHAAAIEGHGKRISGLEQRVLRDEAEFIDAESFLIQEGRSPHVLAPGSGLTEAGFIGSWCARNGCDRGPQKGWSLPWEKRGRTVNTWRRSDLRRALASMLHRDAAH